MLVKLLVVKVIDGSKELRLGSDLISLVSRTILPRIIAGQSLMIARGHSQNILLTVLVIILSTDAHRALELLEEYHSRLSKAQDRPLRNAIERVIRIFKSRLFQALLGK